MAKPALTVVVEMQRQQDAEEERRLSQALALQAYRRVHSKRKVRVGVLFRLRMHRHQASIRGSSSRQRPIASLAAAIPACTNLHFDSICADQQGAQPVHLVLPAHVHRRGLRSGWAWARRADFTRWPAANFRAPSNNLLQEGFPLTRALNHSSSTAASARRQRRQGLPLSASFQQEARRSARQRKQGASTHSPDPVQTGHLCQDRAHDTGCPQQQLTTDSVQENQLFLACQQQQPRRIQRFQWTIRAGTGPQPHLQPSLVLQHRCCCST